MIALSSRYAGWLLLLLGLAAVPLLIEEFRPRRHDDCRHPDMLMLTLPIPGSKPARSSERWRARARGGENEPRSTRGEIEVQSTRGEIENPHEPENRLRFWIVRSFDPARASPRAVLEGAFDPESHEVRRIASEAGPLPVHLAVDRTRDPTRLLAWTWVYDGAPTADVLPALLRAAPRRLLDGAVPITLFLVDGASATGDTSDVDAVATRWIADAWSHMERYCR